jgi:hypothetical protein
MPATKEEAVSKVSCQKSNSYAVNKDEIQLNLSTTSGRSRSTVKTNSDVQEDERSVSSTLKTKRSNSYRSSGKRVQEILSLSDDSSHHSSQVKTLQSKGNTDGKQSQGTQSSPTGSPAVVNADAISPALSPAKGDSKPDEVPNTEAVSARSIENAASFAGFILSSISGTGFSKKPKNASRDNDEDDYMEGFDFDSKDDDGDDASLPFSMTDFLNDIDDISAALSGPLCSVSSGCEEGTAEENDDKEEEAQQQKHEQQAIKETKDQSSPPCKDENSNTAASTSSLVLSGS